MDRRTALSLLVVGGSAGVAGVVGVPILVTAISPALRTNAKPLWKRVGLLEDFTIGDVRQAAVDTSREGWPSTLESLAVYVWRPASAEVIVFSRNCTDLSCPVNWDAKSRCFLCPCHGGIFLQSGEPIAGPPARPLYRYDHRLDDGLLEIDLHSLPPMT